MTGSRQFGCPQCYGSQPEAMWNAISDFSHVARLVDESHFTVNVLECPHCRQRWVKVFTEEIDWVGGNDPQRWTVFPVTTEESQTIVSQGENVSMDLLEKLGRSRRFLRYEWPKEGDKRFVWREGGMIVGPHD
ncbi:MAG: hypothetical protein ACE15C_15945 [Phycisphaerae bacterium]